FQDFRGFFQIDGGGEQFQYRPSPSNDIFTVGFDIHPVRARGHTRGKLHPPASVHRTHPAESVCGQVRVVTDNGDFDPEPGGGVEDGCALGDSDRLAVDGEGDHIFHKFIQK
ncbi:MAG TPA: hypothetical protein VI451_15960, partial [Anaerolineales bacterium]|nr:hypothetical protein [Anaerolineales bacterium]